MLGIAGYLGQFLSPQDLATSIQAFRTYGTDATFSVVRTNNGEYISDPKAGLEASLDIIAYYPTPHIYYSTGAGMTGRSLIYS